VTERNPVRVFIYITFINLIFNCIHIRIKILHGTYSVFLKVRRIRGTGAASTRHRHRLGSSLLPISSLHATLQIPTVLAVSRVQPRSAPRKPVAPAAQDCVIRLSRNRSLSSGCPNVSFPVLYLKHILFRRLAFARPSSPSMLAAYAPHSLILLLVVNDQSFSSCP
jgi:hypothetical protein